MSLHRWPTYIARGARRVPAARPGLLLVAAVALAVPATAGPSPVADDLASLGIAYEEARALAGAARGEALTTTLAALEATEADDLPRERRAAVHLLRGEVLGELAEHRRAAKDLEKAGKEAGDGDLGAATAFARIRVREAAGEEDRAAEEWGRWLERHPGNALAPDARLYLAWNRLRAGDPEEAGAALTALEREHPWCGDDPRLVLALATLAYLEGHPDRALALLADIAAGAAPLYLEALCRVSLGQTLEAAAAYQKVAERHPHSTLRDHALLAKANIFLSAGAYDSAGEEFARLVELARDPAVAAEAALRRAAAVLLGGDPAAAEPLLRRVVADHAATDVAARAQFLLGEAMVQLGRQEDAILEYNRVLAGYFDQAVAASAQYRLGRCFDALGRPGDATGAYQAVVTGYPAEPEAPAAAYLAGVGLLEAARPAAAIPYFQLVLDRYARTESDSSAVVFAEPAHQELVEAALCLLELSYHRTGDLGRLSGAPHLLLERMPPSSSPWRAYALLIDADALAAQGRHAEARASLERLAAEHPGHAALGQAHQLLAWIYAQQGESDLAIRATEEMLSRDGIDPQSCGTAYLNLAHVRFNQQRYEQAAAAYDEFLARYPEHEQALLALYQAGLCFLRLDRGGDAVDRWESLVARDPGAPVAERAWARAGDLYFRTEHYDDAKRCYEGLLEHFAGGSAAALGRLRVAQCDYNAGRDTLALAGYADVLEYHPESPLARDAERGLQSTLYRLGQGEGGIEALAELVERYPGSAFAADAQFEIARRLYAREDFVAAADEFRRVVSRFPDYAAADRAQYLLGDACVQAGDSTGARQAHEQFLLFFTESELRATVGFQLGALYFAAGEYMRAAVAFTGVLDLAAPDETAAAALYNRGLCRSLLGDLPQACSDLELYRETYPADERAVDIALQLGELRDRLGESDLALAELSRALAANPAAAQVTEIQFRIGDIHERRDEPEAAIAAFQRAAVCEPLNDPYRLSAVARCAALYEETENYVRAQAAYRDLAANAGDPTLVAVAAERAAELASIIE